MPKLRCVCGEVLDLSPVPDAGWITVLDADYEALVTAEVLAVCDPEQAHASREPESTFLRVAGLMYECPACGQLMWKRPGDSEFRAYAPSPAATPETRLGWKPLGLDGLESLVAEQLPRCSEAQRDIFSAIRIEPVKWHLHPYGDEGDGFWVVAVRGDLALWYNDIEDGFNVSRFQSAGEIPSEEYWANQDELCWALQTFSSAD